MPVSPVAAIPVPEAPPTGLRQFLRQETAQTHDRLDAMFARYPLATQSGYANFVTAHLVAWRAVGPSWRKVLAELLGIDAPDYAGMLADDLADIGGADHADLPVITFHPPASPAGLAYVLAGSRLGITAIARQPNWGHLNNRGIRFMDDRQGSQIFRQLVAFFDSPPGLALDRQTVRHSAMEGFEVFLRAVAVVEGAKR